MRPYRLRDIYPCQVLSINAMHGPIQSHKTVPLKKLLTFYFMQDREPSGEDAHLQHQKNVSQDLTGQVLPQGLSLLCADLFAVLVSPRPVCMAFNSSFFIQYLLGYTCILSSGDPGRIS
jgi:hypothetical protein